MWAMPTWVEHEWNVEAQDAVGCWTARAGSVSSSWSRPSGCPSTPATWLQWRRSSGHCETCAEKRAQRAPVNKASGTRASKKLDIVHTDDVLGPLHQELYEGFRYQMGFIDCHSRYAAMYPMRTRGEVIEELERFITDVGSPETLV